MHQLLHSKLTEGGQCFNPQSRILTQAEISLRERKGELKDIFFNHTILTLLGKQGVHKISKDLHNRKKANNNRYKIKLQGNKFERSLSEHLK